MPMNGSAMGAAVVEAIQTIDPNMTEDQISQLNSSWAAICGAIVTYIQANGEVAPGIAVATTGSAAAQTGVTTAPGTIL